MNATWNVRISIHSIILKILLQVSACVLAVKAECSGYYHNGCSFLYENGAYSSKVLQEDFETRWLNSERQKCIALKL